MLLNSKRAVCLICLALWFGLAPVSAQTQSQKLVGLDRSQSEVQSSPGKKPPSRRDYAGDDACRSCHAEKSRTYLATSHHLTSQKPEAHSVKGNFSPGANILRTSNPYLHFEMDATRQGYFESAVEEPGPSSKVTHTERIDVVIGSGRKGQTFLFWKGDRLFELPVSYWTDSEGWINSPGYPDGSPHFDKPVVPRCLECHAGYFEPVPDSLVRNRINRASLVLGVTCERCHGPGRAHVLRHSSKLAAQRSTPETIVNPASLPRERQMDICTSCHAGAGSPIAPALSFVPGNALDDYLYIPSTAAAAVDVHGNQMQLLTRSRCYRSSTLTCTTCHDVHQPQRDAAAFSSHCLSCHKVESCGQFAALGAKIASNCIDCHMPLQKSQTLVSNTNGRELKPLVRNHQIAIYPAPPTP